MRRALLCGLLWMTFSARALAEGTAPAAAPPNVLAPAEGPNGWVGLMAGVAFPRVSTHLSESDARSGHEGAASSNINFRLHYDNLLFSPVGARAFVRRTGWHTELSEQGGYGERRLWDFGLAPTLNWHVGHARRGSFFVSVPASFTWSFASGAPGTRVRERIDNGIGFRFGFGFGGLFRIMPRAGFFFETEAATQQVHHKLRYESVDGAAASTQHDLTYNLSWLGVGVGLAMLP